jgi:hypothetical protein
MLTVRCCGVPNYQCYIAIALGVHQLRGCCQRIQKGACKPSFASSLGRHHAYYWEELPAGLCHLLASIGVINICGTGAFHMIWCADTHS